MKRQIVSFVGVLGLLLVAACANAQTLGVTANVPFDFVVNKATMPAGEYSVKAISESSAAALALRNRDSNSTMIALSNEARSLNPSQETKLVFHRYGERYFLSQIWVAGERSGREFAVSKREVEMAKNVQRDQDVIVLAELR